MRSRIALICLVAVAASLSGRAQTPTCADLHIVPAVRECSDVKIIPINEGITISFPDEALDPRSSSLPGNFADHRNKNLQEATSEIESDAFLKADLSDAFHQSGINTDKQTAHILFIHSSHGYLKEFVERRNLAIDAPMKDEGYIITSRGPLLIVFAETPAGLFYGAQTVKQLIHGTGKDAVLMVPTIRDWPAMKHRGLSDDWSRGPLPTMDFLKREIRTLASYKVNVFSPYFEHTFAYASSPVAAYPGGAMTPDEAKELVAYAAKYYITVIPEQESFGHLHHYLKFEQYSGVGETAHGSVLAPGDAGTLPVIAGWFSELAKVFPGPYAHIGADETFELGMGRTHDEVNAKGLGAVYLNFLTQIHTTLAPNKKQLLFWGDVAVNSPELVGTLPKDMIAVPWDYDAKPDFKPIIEPFVKAGLETWVAPGVNNWNRLYPNNNEALGNIRAFVRDGQLLGSTGELNTVWNDDGEGIFDENWVGVLFGAAAGWQKGESSEGQFLDSYGQAFHRDQTGKISQAQREMMAAHAVLRKAGLYDAQDAYFWLDPFSPAGQKISAKMLPVVSEVRLHAERAITLLAEAKAAGKLANPEALDALELGARRIDFMAYKFQAAADCVDLYAKARSLPNDKEHWGEIQNLIYTIGENNGRLKDIRDGYTQLRALYEQAWLRDNRVYSLQNNLSHFDAAAQLWIGRCDSWNVVMEHWWDTHTLNAPEDLGMPVAATPAAVPAAK